MAQSLHYILAAVLTATPVSAAQLEFDMLRKGKDIGDHSITYSLTDEHLIVDVNIKIKVKFAFITAFKYVHENREIWTRDGSQLLSIETKTNDNGRKFTVNGRQVEGGFEVRAGDTTYMAEPGITPTSYWHPRTPQMQVLLNTQKGELAQVELVGEEGRYAIGGDIQDVNLTYDANGCLTGLDFMPPKNKVPIFYEIKTAYEGSALAELAAHPLLGPCIKDEVNGA